MITLYNFEYLSFTYLSIDLIERNMQLVISQVQKCILDKRPKVKANRGCNILKILPSFNGRFIGLYRFIFVRIILRFIPK